MKYYANVHHYIGSFYMTDVCNQNIFSFTAQTPVSPRFLVHTSITNQNLRSACISDQWDECAPTSDICDYVSLIKYELQIVLFR